MKRVILASTSPRRVEILSKTNLEFDVVKCEYEEDMSLPLHPAQLAESLALGKAESIAHNYEDSVIIAADTFVIFEDKILGKPASVNEARSMLNMLSGKMNQVVTGVAIIDTSNNSKKEFHCMTNVFMKELPTDTIESYLHTGEPLDKAGAYALQGYGSVLIEKIEGDFFSAMGLPISRLADILKEFDIDVLT